VVYNTLIGTPTVVDLSDFFMMVTFSNVTREGSTTRLFYSEPLPGPLPAGFQLAGSPLGSGIAYSEIVTTATYSGLVTVVAYYDETTVTDENNLRALCWDGTKWIDVTLSIDTVNNTFTAQATA